MRVPTIKPLVSEWFTKIPWVQMQKRINAKNVIVNSMDWFACVRLKSASQTAWRGQWLQKSQRFIFYSFTNDSFRRVNFAIICSHTMQYFDRKSCYFSRIVRSILISTDFVWNTQEANWTECTQLVNWNYCRIASTQIRDIVVYYLPFSFLTSVPPSTAKYTNISTSWISTVYGVRGE